LPETNVAMPNRCAGAVVNTWIVWAV